MAAAQAAATGTGTFSDGIATIFQGVEKVVQPALPTLSGLFSAVAFVGSVALIGSALVVPPVL